MKHTLLFLLLINFSIVFASSPNILLIVVDDMGYSDLQCFGSEISTPNIDEIANEGIRFRQFYNSAKCEPTRSMIMSGQHWHYCGIGIKKGPTMGEVMKSANYRTYAIGKWHLDGNPVDRGFDHYFGHLKGATNYFKGDKSFRLDSAKYPRPKNFYATKAYGDFAIKFIEEGHEKHPGKPFFMYLAHSAPHSPLMALPEDIELFKDTYKVGWDVIRQERLKRQLEMGIIDKKWPIPDFPSSVPAWDSLSAKEQEVEAYRMAMYAAMLYRVDQSVGRVMDKLEELGLKENTLVMFMSDNGANPFDRGRKNVPGAIGQNHNYGLGWAFTSNTPYRFYKRNQNQGGACTGAIFSWPKVIHNHGEVIDAPGHILDLMTTFMDISGAKYPATYNDIKLSALTGTSLLPILKGEKVKDKRTLYFHLFDNAAIIDDNWKLVKAFGNDWELYDLSKDRAETNNLVSEKKDIADELLKDFTQWQGKNELRNNGKEPQYIYLNSNKKK
ncbi:MAG: arylsulfatase [Bacteroidales bacterium]|nr:arylsulfatase [Bacteroidales bacterium]